MTRCHVCDARCERQVEPAITREGEVVLPAVMARDVWTIVMRNGVHVDACLSCWMKWPDEWKVFPSVGFGSDRPMLGLVLGGRT